MNGRRKFLLGSLGVVAGGATAAWFAKNQILKNLVLMIDNSDIAVSPASAFDGDCVLTADSTEGPYFVRSAMRKDIRDDRKGKEMNLRFKLVNVADCSPVQGATVEIWHCDADGVYSGYPEELARDIWGTLRFVNFSDANVPPINEKRFLRGAQVTDADGVCEFTTIVPGWYDGRCPHIHLKVLAGEKDVFTSQFFFNEAFLSRTYTTIEPYRTHGDSPYTHRSDIVISEAEAGMNGLVLQPSWSDEGPVVASAKIGLKLG